MGQGWRAHWVFFLKVKGSSAKENLAAQNKPVNSKHWHCTKLVKRLLNFGVELWISRGWLRTQPGFHLFPTLDRKLSPDRLTGGRDPDKTLTVSWGHERAWRMLNTSMPRALEPFSRWSRWGFHTVEILLEGPELLLSLFLLLHKPLDRQQERCSQHW